MTGIRLTTSYPEVPKCNGMVECCVRITQGSVSLQPLSEHLDEAWWATGLPLREYNCEWLLGRYGYLSSSMLVRASLVTDRVGCRRNPDWYSDGSGL